MEPIQNYTSTLQQTMGQLPEQLIADVIAILQRARLQGNQVFIMGNGGSASTASHFVCDLAKNTRREGLPHFRVIGLTDNMGIFSAYANDEGYENVFEQQLANLADPGDVVVAISASGNSKNVLKGVDFANNIGATTIGFTGFTGECESVTTPNDPLAINKIGDCDEMLRAKKDLDNGRLHGWLEEGKAYPVEHFEWEKRYE